MCSIIVVQSIHSEKNKQRVFQWIVWFIYDTFPWQHDVHLINSLGLFFIDCKRMPLSQSYVTIAGYLQAVQKSLLSPNQENHGAMIWVSDVSNAVWTCSIKIEPLYTAWPRIFCLRFSRVTQSILWKARNISIQKQPRFNIAFCF